MELKTRSFRVRDAWAEHLSDQTDRLKKMIGRQPDGRGPKLWQVMGAAIMNFRPADNPQDLAIFRDFSRVEQVKASIGDPSKLTAAEKAELRKLLE